MCSCIHDEKGTHCRYIHVLALCYFHLPGTHKGTVKNSKYRLLLCSTQIKCSYTNLLGKNPKSELHAKLVIFRIHTNCSRVSGTTVHAGVDFAMLFSCLFGVVPSMSVFFYQVSQCMVTWWYFSVQIQLGLICGGFPLNTLIMTLHCC